MRASKVYSKSSQDDSRPSPDELLDRYQLRDGAGISASGQTASGDSHRPKRARLRIYLGMAAGVGKTFAMLNEGRRRESRGTDVVIGYVETHGRTLTAAQIGDLEVIPRKRIIYRGVTLDEMDVDAVLARHPQVALVDELAHTNVPGSRHEKRYQDVEELLAAGITVIATLNIQHLEGLNDLVEAITGVRQRETLPDRVLDEADEVELVDVSPEALRARMRHGNIYPPERAQHALGSFFTPENLTALRELALRRIAEKTSEQLEALMEGRGAADAEPWRATATERVMVAFESGPRAQQLIRDAWRLARGLRAPLLAVTVIRPGTIGAMSDAVRKDTELAEDLGADVLTVEGRAVAATLARIARERHITQIVVGQPARNWWKERLGSSVLNRLLQARTGADIHIVTPRGAGQATQV